MERGLAREDFWAAQTPQAGGKLPACGQGCVSVLSQRLSPLQPFKFGAVASGESRGASGESLGASGRPGDAGCMLMLAGAGGDGKSRGSAASAAAPTRRGCRVICPRQKGGLGGDAANANEGLP